MGLDYSQKRLLNTPLRDAKKGRGKRRATLSSMRQKRQFPEKLELYAFWTGFMSTIISLIQVIILALKK
jgi:hypothetical protein